MEPKRREEWWMLAVPLELAVMARMGLHYPTVAELEANGWQDPRPLPDSSIVQEELKRLEALRFDSLDLDAHLADEFGTDDDDDDGELMDPLGATLTEEEQRERFGGYGRGGEE